MDFHSLSQFTARFWPRRRKDKYLRITLIFFKRSKSRMKDLIVRSHFSSYRLEEFDRIPHSVNSSKYGSMTYTKWTCDPWFIDRYIDRRADTIQVVVIVRRALTFNRASQSMMNYSTRSRGGVAVVLFFPPFSFFLFPFVYSFISRRFIDSGREPTGRLTANNLLALPRLARLYPQRTVHSCNAKMYYICAMWTRYMRDISVQHTRTYIYTYIIITWATRNLNTLACVQDISFKGVSRIEIIKL